MKKVTLQFENILLLIDFLDVVRNYKCEFNRRDLTVTCELSEAQVELARNGYNATVLAFA